MAGIPNDYLVDALRMDLAQLGCSRVILLGSLEDMEGPDLRYGLARWGVQVLVPPQEHRGWIAELGEGPAQDAQSVQSLKALLADGLEHGVEALVAMNAQMAAVVRACELGVPVIEASPRGAIAPLKNIVFDMGGVLFRWDPLAMARRVASDGEDVRLLAREVFGSPEWAWMDAGAVDEQTVLWTAKARLPRRLHAAAEQLVLHWHNHRVTIEGMDALIRDLKADGYGIYLLSNAGESFDRYEAQLPARACFDGLVVSYREHVVKPDARIYQALIDLYGLTPAECLFIDDTPKNVLGARRVGMRGWHFDGDVQALRAALLG